MQIFLRGTLKLSSGSQNLRSLVGPFLCHVSASAQWYFPIALINLGVPNEFSGILQQSYLTQPEIERSTHVTLKTNIQDRLKCSAN